MLVQRIVTAIALLAILLPALFAEQATWFMAVALILMALAAWEWGNLNGGSKTVSIALGASCVALCGVAWALDLPHKNLPTLWLLIGSAWVLLSLWLLKLGVTRWSTIAPFVRLLGGLLVLVAAWLAVAQARLLGINFILSVLVLVWVSDIGAYFVGRAVGKRKLAPSISPGKSWEGVWGAMVAVLLLALAWLVAEKAFAWPGHSFYARLSATNPWLLGLAMLFMTAMGVVGDLVESLVKRAAGAKDSSGLLPGHGGVLDRVDALLPTLPLAMMLASNLSPSR